MIVLKIRNPFGAPVYHEETVTSTMDISRQLESRSEAHGTVIAADFQEKGRGRIRGRIWEMEKKMSLPLTILLRYPRIEDIPAALTLRTGLAVSNAIEDFAPSLQGRVMVKWPNDIMIGSKKTAGILCEAANGNVHIGIGINVYQKEFPAHLREKATSIALAESISTDNTSAVKDERFSLLEKILARLYAELETSSGEEWKSRLEKRLYKKGSNVVFKNGAAGSGETVTGCLAGIDSGGELLIIPDGENKARSFITGELVF